MIGALRVLLHCRDDLILALLPWLDAHLLDIQAWIVLPDDGRHNRILLFDVGGGDGISFIEVNVLPAMILPYITFCNISQFCKFVLGMLPWVHTIELIIILSNFLPDSISFLDNTEITNRATHILGQTHLIEFSVIGTTYSLTLILAYLGFWID